MDGLEAKTLLWQFVESLEPPEVIAVKCQELKKPDNRYAQITVRFHTRQVSCAVCDYEVNLP